MSSLTRLSFGVYNRLAKWIVPGHCHTQRVYHQMLGEVLLPGVEWLDLGCGHQIMPSWVQADEKSLVAGCRRAVGIDLDFPSLQKNRIIRDRTMGTLEQLPFPDNRFDVVTANMVVEHLAEPLVVLREIQRVLRPGGRFLFHTPNRNAPSLRMAAHTPEGLKKSIIWALERRHEDDVFPTLYRMNTVQDVNSLAGQAGLQVERLEQRNSVAVTAMLGPFALPELLFLRVVQRERFRGIRSNILAVLRK